MQWEALINSDELFSEQFSKSIYTMDSSSIDNDKKDVVKLSIKDLKRSTFINGNKFIYFGRPMTILIPPSINQRVRYANECEKILRFISVPNYKTMTIGVNITFSYIFYYPI